MEKRKVMIICGYGTELTQNYQQYLRYAHTLIIDNEIKTVIASGGRTQLETSRSSEAKIIANFINDLGWNDNRLPPFVFADSTPMTTDRNLQSAATIIRGWNFHPKTCSIVIVCDQSHRHKVDFFSQKYLGDFNIEIKTFPLCDGLLAKLQPLLTLYDILGYYFPPLEWIKLEIKKLRAKYS